MSYEGHNILKFEYNNKDFQIVISRLIEVYLSYVKTSLKYFSQEFIKKNNINNPEVMEKQIRHDLSLCLSFNTDNVIYSPVESLGQITYYEFLDILNLNDTPDTSFFYDSFKESFNKNTQYKNKKVVQIKEYIDKKINCENSGMDLNTLLKKHFVNIIEKNIYKLRNDIDSLILKTIEKSMSGIKNKNIKIYYLRPSL